MIGFALFGVFYWVETLPSDEMDALIPPSTWRLRNVALLSGLSLTPAFWVSLPCIQGLLRELTSSSLRQFFAVQSSLSERSARSW